MVESNLAHDCTGVLAISCLNDWSLMTPCTWHSPWPQCFGTPLVQYSSRVGVMLELPHRCHSIVLRWLTLISPAMMVLCLHLATPGSGLLLLGLGANSFLLQVAVLQSPRIHCCGYTPPVSLKAPVNLAQLVPGSDELPLCCLSARYRPSLCLPDLSSPFAKVRSLIAASSSAEWVLPATPEGNRREGGRLENGVIP